MTYSTLLPHSDRHIPRTLESACMRWDSPGNRQKPVSSAAVVERGYVLKPRPRYGATS